MVEASAVGDYLAGQAPDLPRGHVHGAGAECAKQIDARQEVVRQSATSQARDQLQEKTLDKKKKKRWTFSGVVNVDSLQIQKTDQTFFTREM